MIFALLLSFEVAGHGLRVIKWFSEGIHYFPDVTGFDYIIQGFHVFQKGSRGDAEVEFLIFIIEVCNEFRWDCFFKVLWACLSEVAFVLEESKVLLVGGPIDGMRFL